MINELEALGQLTVARAIATLPPDPKWSKEETHWQRWVQRTILAERRYVVCRAGDAMPNYFSPETKMLVYWDGRDFRGLVMGDMCDPYCLDKLTLSAMIAYEIVIGWYDYLVGKSECGVVYTHDFLSGIAWERWRILPGQPPDQNKMW